MNTQRWQPDHLVQLLITRGYLEQDQALFARATMLLDGHPTLLDAVRAEALVDDATIERVAAEARQDALVRELVTRYGLLGEEALADAHRLQRGTRRSLLRTLVDEGFLVPAAVRALFGGGPVARLAPAGGPIDRQHGPSVL